MTDFFDHDFAAAIAKASQGRDTVKGSTGVVAFGVGKKVGIAVQIVDGQIVGSSENAPDAALLPDATLVFANGSQVEEWLGGNLNLSQAYMRGDFKPVGSMGAIAAALELLDDPQVLAKLAAAST